MGQAPYREDPPAATPGLRTLGTGALQAAPGSAFNGLTHNLSASAPPTVNDDSGDGYGVGSLWIDTTNDVVWQAVDVTLAAARWRVLSHSPAELLMNGSAPTYRESHPRWAVDSSITTVSGTPIIVALPLYAGDVVTSLTFASGAIALAAGTTPGTPHLWFALYDTSLSLISQSADEGNAAAWATFTAKTKALGAPYTVPVSGVYYAVANVVAGTGGSPAQPTVRGSAGNSPIPAGVLASQKPLGGTCGSGLGATAAAGPLTITSAAYPYCVAS